MAAAMTSQQYVYLPIIPGLFRPHSVKTVDVAEIYTTNLEIYAFI